MIGSLLVVFIYPYLGLPFDQALVGYTLSFVLVVGVSLVTQHDKSEIPKAAIRYRLSDYKEGNN